ncbi:MAG TPA: hypothetical protein GXZ55_00095, partial [Natronincola sp.]|nr:hypothetical protein [Natronincola sp.]
MMLYLWMWWKGYVTIRLRGPGLERLLNKIATLDIQIFKIHRLTEDTMIIRMGAKNYAQLRPLLRGSPIRITILDRHGLPFLIQRFKIRSFLVVGLVASLSFMIYLSNFIWFIEVEGNENISPALLNIAIEDLRIQTGVKRSSINSRALESELLLRFPSLSWVKISVEGVKLQILLSERKGIEEDYGGAGHVYA